MFSGSYYFLKGTPFPRPIPLFISTVTVREDDPLPSLIPFGIRRPFLVVVVFLSNLVTILGELDLLFLSFWFRDGVSQSVFIYAPCREIDLVLIFFFGHLLCGTGSKLHRRTLIQNFSCSLLWESRKRGGRWFMIYFCSLLMSTSYVFYLTENSRRVYSYRYRFGPVQLFLEKWFPLLSLSFEILIGSELIVFEYVISLSYFFHTS